MVRLSRVVHRPIKAGLPDVLPARCACVVPPWRRCVAHIPGESLSCTSPHSPSFFRHDEEILGHDQEHPDRWRHGFAVRRAGQSLLGESYFHVAVAFGRSAAVCNTSHSLADQHAAPFALRAWWRKAASPPQPSGEGMPGSASVGIGATNFVMTKFSRSRLRPPALLLVTARAL